MKKIILSFIFNILFLTVVYSQAYNPLIRENVYWDENHGSGQHICFLSGGDRFFFQGDTIINSIQYGDTAWTNNSYKILKAHPLYAIAPGPYCAPFGVNDALTNVWAFMREDTALRQVYLLDNNTNTEALLFDFSLNVGDTLVTLGSSYPIDSMGTINLFSGGTRTIWYVNSPNNAYYIEGIGGSQGVYHNFDIGLGFWEIPMCVTENNLGIWGDECATIVGIEEVNTMQHLRVYPNPVSDVLFIEKDGLDECEFVIWDVYANVMLEKTICSTLEQIDVVGFPKGIYFYSLKYRLSGQVIRTWKFIKS